MVTRTLPVNGGRDPGGLVASGGTSPNLARGPFDLSRDERQSRVSAAAMVVVLHAAMIVLVLLSRSARPVSASPGLAAFNVATGGDHAPRRPASHPRQPHVAPANPVPLVQVAAIDPFQSLPAVSNMADVSLLETPAAIGGGCDLTQPVQDALRHSDDVRKQLPAIPADRRSVANAVMVWNAGWIDTADAPARTALATIRQTITQAITASSADCRNQPQRGPRLLYLPGPTGKTTVLALGSGQWTWQQLVDGKALPAEVAAAGAEPSAPFASPVRTAAAPGQTLALDALLASLTRKRTPMAFTVLPVTP